MKNDREPVLRQTHTGRMVNPLDPKPEDICLEDIAHALSLQCRFNGHTKTFYSVAQHSINVATMLGDKSAPWGLMHDAAEAYVGDVARPIKELIPGFSEMEDVVLSVIGKKYGLKFPIPREVWEADDRMLMTEKRDFLFVNNLEWGLDAEPYQMKLQTGFIPEFAKKSFLSMCVRFGIHDS